MDEDVIFTRRGDAEILLEGDEHIRVYARTDKIVFAVGTLLPGQRSPLDPGHGGAHEVAYQIEGEVVVHLPDRDRYYHLEPGDAMVVPEGEAHTVVCVSATPAVTVWATAPNLGRPALG